MRPFKDPKTKWKMAKVITCLCIIYLFVVFSKRESYFEGFNERVKNAPSYAVPAQDGTPTNVVSPSVEDDDCYPVAREIICIEDLPDIAGVGDGKRFFKTTVRKEDGTCEVYVNWVPITKWESILLSIVKGRFQRQGVSNGED